MTVITGEYRNPLGARPPGRYRFLDVFAGISGFRFGFEPQGGECVWSCEIDPYARRTYVANHRERMEDIFPDVRKAGPEDVPDHEVLIAGFSCQTFSKAGVSKLNALGRPHGFEDTTRGTLFFEICRILATHRPVAFLLENVPNLVHHDDGRTFQAVRDILTGELGYHISHRVLDARSYVPQHRRRVFIAGHLEPDRPRLDDKTAARTTAKVSPFIPPATDPAAPPMNIHGMKVSLVKSSNNPKSTTVNPAVLPLTEWKTADTTLSPKLRLPSVSARPYSARKKTPAPKTHRNRLATMTSLVSKLNRANRRFR